MTDESIESLRDRIASQGRKLKSLNEEILSLIKKTKMKVEVVGEKSVATDDSSVVSFRSCR